MDRSGTSGFSTYPIMDGSIPSHPASDMRLSPREIRVIRETVTEVFGPGVTVSLFGSRIDDTARGGDIDLLIESDVPIPDRLRKNLQLGARLQIRLGEQPIDILMVDPNVPMQPIHEQARRTGIRL